MTLSALPDARSTIEGQRLGHYRVLHAIGSGGMGEVYAAEDTRLHRRIALKRLTSEMAADPDRLRRFEREAQAIAALNHPNVVTVYSVEESDGVHFLTMELVEGKTLSELIPKSGLPLAQFMKIAVPLADAIKTAHQVGIIHRDLKPSNVMVTADGRLKVLDFGLAKLKRQLVSDDSMDSSVTTEQQLTGDNRIIGTAPYMSPEQAQGLSVDHRSDIFSIGTLLYEMATGMRPFRGSNSLAVISSILKDSPPPLAELNPTLPEELDRIVARCMAKDPERRFQSSLDLRNELEELGQRVTSEKITAAPPPARLAAPSWTRVALVLGVLGAAIALALLWILQRTNSPSTAPPLFRQLTFDPGVECFPSISPDGKWVVYSGEAAGNRDIYLQSVSGQTPLNLTKDSLDDDFNPVFSRDGERIAFRSSREGGGLFVMGRTGEAVRRLTRSGFNPSWSPDGKQLVFATEHVELRPMNWEGKSKLWVVSADGGTPRSLEAEGVQPSWSPHGQRIAFVVRGTYPRQMDLATIPATGGAPVSLTKDAATDWNPAWSPDGRYLYFGSDRGGTMNLWRIRLDESSGNALAPPEPITTPASLLAHISVSQDGRRIAYASALLTQNIQKMAFDPASGEVRGDPSPVTTGSRLWSSPDASADGEWVVFYSQGQPEGDLYVSGIDGTRLRQVTGDSAVDRVPRWSPDGEWIACFSNRAGPFDLWKVRPDGSDLTQITAGAGVTYAAWSPDGSRIATSAGGVGDLPQGTYIVDPNRPGSQQKAERLPPFPGGRFIANSWSPDGAQIAGQIEMTGKGIATWSMRDRRYRRWTDYGEWPVWLPDSRRILFVSRGKQFYILDTGSGEVRQIFSSPRDVFGPPRFGGPGDAIYFSRRATESDVWIATLDER